MALTDAIVASIEAELEAIKEITPEPVSAAPVITAPTTNLNPILQMAIDQAAFRLARETEK
jgi:hypothetical protein